MTYKETWWRWGAHVYQILVFATLSDKGKIVPGSMPRIFWTKDIRDTITWDWSPAVNKLHP